MKVQAAILLIFTSSCFAQYSKDGSNAFELNSDTIYFTGASMLLTMGFIIPQLPLENAVGMKAMANGAAVFSIITLIPFVAYIFRFSKGWTGMHLNAAEKKIIEPGHIVGLFFWLTIGTVQTLTVGRAQKFHNKLGVVGFAVISYCIMELLTNAVFSFVPGKPMLLARATFDRNPTNSEIAMFTNCFLFALMVPFGTAFHGYHAAKSVMWAKERSIRKHVHHVICMMTWILNPGLLRIIIRSLHFVSGCQPFTSREDTILVQTTSSHISSTFLAIHHWLMYATLPKNLKKDSAIVFMRWFTLPVILWQIAACYLLGVNPWHTCEVR